MGEAGAATRPRRADAQRNYERILSAARSAVAERGGDVVLEDVARGAGVGIGTLYRHFPTRQALLEATFLDEARELRARAEALVGDICPFEALVGWLRLQVDFGMHGHSMGAAVLNAKHTGGSEIQVACSAARGAGTELLRRAQAAGEVRADVEMGDVLRLLYALVLVNGTSPDLAQVERMFDLVIAGIRA
ncbi:MAG: TetR/AcrR family transcriptional regulator [Acidimicrobiales bacterium]